MIKFITALVDNAGVIVGAHVGDMPADENFRMSGATPVSVGSVVTTESSPPNLVEVLRALFVIAADPVTGKHTVTLPETAKQHVSSIFHHASTIGELVTTPTINPLVANWLSMRLHADHEMKDRVDEEAAKAPHLASVVKDMAQRRFTPYELTPMQRLARKEQRIAAKLQEPK